jgi:hypothetical protein
MGNKFTSTKASPASTDQPCVADSITGVSTGTDFTNCASYVSNTIPLTDGNGNHVTVGLSVLSSPVFTSPATLTFSPGTPSTQTITAVGNPTPAICLTSGTRINNFIFNNDQPCASGSFPIVFNGSLFTETQTYNLAFVASNNVGATATQVAINVTPQLNIISPNTFNGVAGLPVNFLVVATGSPTPKLSAGNQGLLGLGFQDNGNGTATISGVVPFPQSSICIGGPQNCGISATNSQGTVYQYIQINMANPPLAVLLPPTSATFIAGAANQTLLHSTGAITPVTWGFQQDPFAPAPWLSLHDNGNGTALLEGTPPVGTTGTFNPYIGPGATGSLQEIFPFPVTVENIPVFTSPNTAVFTVGTSGSFDVSINQGTVSLVNSLPTGLSFTSGNSPAISGTPATGTGGQYTVTLTDDAGSAGSATQALTLNVYEAPQITSPDTATFFTGMPGSFAVTTTGFPSLSAQAVPPNSLPPTSPTQGQGMYFTVTGLPPDLQFGNLNPAGLATGTLTIFGTPSVADKGVHQVQITAQNGVGQSAQQTLRLDIIHITGPAPTSGNRCNGNYNGTFQGSITVSAGQNCTFVGGGITGNVTVNGGNLALANAKVTGNVSIQGRSAFSIDQGSEITGTLGIRKDVSRSSTNQICGAKLDGNVVVSTNATPIQIGSSDVSCTGNSFGGNLVIDGNTAATTVYNNTVGKILSCAGNTSITGGGDSAHTRRGQCSAF